MKSLKIMLLLLLVLTGVSLSLSLAGSVNDTSDNSQDSLTISQKLLQEDEEDDDEETSTEEEDEDEVHDEDEEEEKKTKYERSVEIETNEGDKIQIESVLKTGENKDKIKFEIKAEGDKIEVVLKYKSESETQEFSFKYRVEFKKIIEYVDEGVFGNGYQSGEDVSDYKIGQSGWNPFSYTEDTSTVVNESIHVFTASTNDGVFSLTFKIAGSILDLGNATLTPNSIKIDVGLSDFPYTVNDSSLTIKTKVETEYEQELKDESTEEGTGFSDNETEIKIGSLTDETQGFFSWANTAIADGKIIEVISAPLVDTSEEEDDLEEGEMSFQTFFSFNTTNAQNIVWDPKVGVISQGTVEELNKIESSSSSSNVPGFEIWFLLSLFSIVYVIRTKYRKI
ncbi:MAG: hypothetical protein ACXAC7_09560 [Candidatus Hodarchaeales archaeon]|jgi:hypothetical protein